MSETSYNEITALDPFEQIRLRPGMYVGSVESDTFNSATVNLLREIYFNSIDEFVEGYGDTIELDFTSSENKVRVRDYGRGVPFSFNKEQGCSNLELAFGRVNSGAKYFKESDQTPFKMSIGCNGVGAKATNALSKYFKATSYRSGKAASVTFIEGVLQGSIEYFDTTEKDGTEVIYIPDPTIVLNPLKPEYIHRLVEETAYLNQGVKTIVNIDGTIQEYFSENGIQDYLHKMLDDNKVLFEFPTISGQIKENSYEIALAVTEGSFENIYPYVNGGAIEVSSTPVQAARSAFARAIKQYLSESQAVSTRDKDIDIKSDDIRSGLVGVIKIKHIKPDYDSQSKTRMLSTDISRFIQKDLPSKLKKALYHNTSAAKDLTSQIVIQAKARIAADEARKTTLQFNKTKKVDLNIKLDDYQPPLSRDPSNNTLYIFEGASPAGIMNMILKKKNPETGKTYREHCGVFGLRGMCLNPIEVPLEKTILFDKYAQLVKILGLNLNNPDDLSKLTFSKIAIATDADLVGGGICVIFLGLFASHFPKLIENGHVFRLLTPLFSYNFKETGESKFIYMSEDKSEVFKRWGYTEDQISEMIAKGEIYLNRYKGFGGMEISDALETVVINPHLVSLQTDDIKTLNRMLFTFWSQAKNCVIERKNLIKNSGLKRLSEEV